MKANISVIIIANYVLRNTLMDSDVQLREMTEEEYRFVDFVQDSRRLVDYLI